MNDKKNGEEQKQMQMKISEAKVRFSADGLLQGESVAVSVKRYRDAKLFYQKEDDSLSDDTVMYEVYQYAPEADMDPGHLNWGLTVMQPVTAGGECNMTRGHFHQDTRCAEIYCGVSGQGLLLLMDEQGKTWAEQVEPGTVHYIQGRLAHRLVNTGDDVFKVAACWPEAAGHDYERIEKLPFAFRIFKKENRLEIKIREEGQE